MAKRNFRLLLSSLVVAASLAGVSAGSAHDAECIGAPDAKPMSLPSPLDKWAQIGCTPFGQALGSRNGWVWASLDDAAAVSIVAGTLDRLSDSPDASFFTAIEMHELQPQERDVALAAFDRGLKFKNTEPKAYRAELTIASGDVASLVFFDFGAFAGGMWCPKDICIPESRFLIMKKESKGQITAALRPAHPDRARLG
jgi:hypothetical protein